MVYASYDNVSHHFQIKTYFKEHNYLVISKNKRVTVKWLAANYLHKFKCIHAIKLVDLKDLVKEDIKVDLTLSQLRRAKLFTMTKLEGDRGCGTVLVKFRGQIWERQLS